MTNVRALRPCPYCQEHGGDGSKCSVAFDLDAPQCSRFETWREEAEYWHAAAIHAEREKTDLRAKLNVLHAKLNVAREQWIEELGTRALVDEIERQRQVISKHSHRTGAEASLVARLRRRVSELERLALVVHGHRPASCANGTKPR